ncbi:helix-turn-helix transcriptional regulator [Corynebacterium mendelii]|uniref:Winged helix-turn-helix transcriptional regulator n=1 Tax=Corynebacterium mendelii TaxID=2765362 RepID=A0A939DZ26_9CORY|nr:winged helix-turn-helix transcriptional regulator [Corynebacterium mendelii]MBN9643454.1 winged helix-turn-helix transcriptional regulator [Corynebacterium mendelii]
MPAGTTHDDHGTRHLLLQTLLAHPRYTAAQLADSLSLTTAGVRRHLSALSEEGLVEAVKARTKPGRGRPAKAFRLTESGRAIFGHAYDLLATQALAALEESGGRAAVKRFARTRAERITGSVSPAQCSGDPEQIAHLIADAFTDNGYSVTVQRAGHGVQICHHHCPIAKVAHEFPELCEAEHDVIGNLVGHHIQPLATIPDGHGVCTTNIPLLDPDTPTDDRAGPPTR